MPGPAQVLRTVVDVLAAAAATNANVGRVLETAAEVLLAAANNPPAIL